MSLPLTLDQLIAQQFACAFNKEGSWQKPEETIPPAGPRRADNKGQLLRKLSSANRPFQQAASFSEARPGNGFVLPNGSWEGLPGVLATLSSCGPSARSHRSFPV